MNSRTVPAPSEPEHDTAQATRDGIRLAHGPGEQCTPSMPYDPENDPLGTSPPERDIKRARAHALPGYEEAWRNLLIEARKADRMRALKAADRARRTHVKVASPTLSAPARRNTGRTRLHVASTNGGGSRGPDDDGDGDEPDGGAPALSEAQVLAAEARIKRLGWAKDEVTVAIAQTSLFAERWAA